MDVRVFECRDDCEGIEYEAMFLKTGIAGG